MDFVFISHIYVVFTDNTSLWWLKPLRRGFRHCYILARIAPNNLWLELNPMSNQTFIFIRSLTEDLNYFQKLRHEGCKIVRLKVQAAELRPAPLNIFSCVEFVKRVVGIHKFSIITPYQLYKNILVNRNKFLDN